MIVDDARKYLEATKAVVSQMEANLQIARATVKAAEEHLVRVEEMQKKLEEQKNGAK